MGAPVNVLRECVSCKANLAETDLTCPACGEVRSVLRPEVDVPPVGIELLRAWRAARERYLASLGPEDRAAVEAREAEYDRACEAFNDEEARTFELAEAARNARERKARTDRKAGRIGTQTELGRPFGLTAQKVGRILDEHGLRELVDLTDEEYEARVPGSLEMWVRTWAPRRATFTAEHQPVIPVTIRPGRPPNDPPFEPKLMRGILDGYATAEGYWIVAKVVPLIQAHLAKTP